MYPFFIAGMSKFYSVLGDHPDGVARLGRKSMKLRRKERGQSRNEIRAEGNEEYTIKARASKNTQEEAIRKEDRH